MRIHPRLRVITEQPTATWPTHAWRTRTRRATANADSWLLTLEPSSSGHGETQLLLRGPAHGLPAGSLVAPQTLLTYRITEQGFRVQNIEVTPDLWRRGIATALATRTHQILAPTLKPLIEPYFADEKGEAWAAAMCAHGWSLYTR